MVVQVGKYGAKKADGRYSNIPHNSHDDFPLTPAQIAEAKQFIFKGKEPLSEFIPAPKPVPQPVPVYTPSSFTGSASPKAPQAKAGINPAYLVGGIAAAGMGAAALSSDKPQPESLLEKAGNGVVGAMDTVAGATGSVLGLMGMPMQLVFGASMGTAFLGAPVAAGVDWVRGNKNASAALGKFNNKMEVAQNATFSQLGKKMGVGNALGSGIEKAVNVSAPVLNTASKLPGLKGLSATNVKSAVKTASQTSVMHGTMRTMWLTGASLGIYGAAREFGGQLTALRQMVADDRGVDIGAVSSLDVLTSGNLSKHSSQARSQILKISGAHITAAVAGMGMALKTHLVDKHLDKLFGKLGFAGGGLLGIMAMNYAYEIPDKVSEIATGFVGDPIAEVYKGMRDAEKNGAKFSETDFAEFALRANEQLKNRGHVGEQIALQLGQQYVAEGLSLNAVLHESSGGKMQERIDAIVAKNTEAAAEAPKKEVVGKYTQRVVEGAPQAAAQPVAPANEVVGAHTQKLHDKAQTTNPDYSLGA